MLDGEGACRTRRRGASPPTGLVRRSPARHRGRPCVPRRSADGAHVRHEQPERDLLLPAFEQDRLLRRRRHRPHREAHDPWDGEPSGLRPAVSGPGPKPGPGTRSGTGLRWARRRGRASGTGPARPAAPSPSSPSARAPRRCHAPCLAHRDEGPERSALEAVDPRDRALVAVEAEDGRQQLFPEASGDQLGGDEVNRRHELLEVVVADDQPLEAELVAAALDLRVRVRGRDVEQLLELVLGPDELGRRSGLKMTAEPRSASARGRSRA